MSAILRVYYSCEACGIVDAAVEVPARGAEDVVAWLEGRCMAACVADHERRSPACRPRSLQNLKVPIGGAQRVGDVPGSAN